MSESSKAWRCLVCGYVHHGDAAPSACPVCGAPDTDFEQYVTAAAPAKPKVRQWRCVICGYEHDGDAPPEHCPVCAASSDDFEPVAQPTTTASAPLHGDARRIIIVGGGIAGVSAAEHARSVAPDAAIHLYSKETEPPYYRLNLTRYLAGEIGEEALPIHPQHWYDEHNIHLTLGAGATAIDPNAHTVELADGGRVEYDKLILACGAHPFIPPIPGSEKAGVAAVRTRQDAGALIERMAPGVSCVCIGGGILGLETAGALARRGASVTLLEGFGHLLPRQLNQDAARVLERHIAGLGITVRTKANTREIVGDDKATAVVLDSGETLPADIVTITTGVRSNTHLARRAGLQVKGGIIVDSHLRTSNADIYAVGDAAEWDGIVYGLWEPAHYQGAIAGQNAAGANIEFGGVPRMNTLKVCGIDLFSIGVISPDDGSYVEVAAEEDRAYRSFLFHDNILVGAILVGDAKIAASLVRAIKDRSDFSSLLGKRPAARDIVGYLSE